MNVVAIETRKRARKMAAEHGIVHILPLPMPLWISSGTLLGVSLIAQVAGEGVDWANVGAVSAVIVLLGFVITKIVPGHTEAMKALDLQHQETLRALHVANEAAHREKDRLHTESLDRQRESLLSFVENIRCGDPASQNEKRVSSRGG